MTLPVNPTMENRGFTLIELMIAMAIGAIVMASVMTSFLSQHRSYLAQDDVVEMQQNGRVAMDMLIRDIRSAGYDPNNIGASIKTAGADNLAFTREDELSANGLEKIEYSLFDAFSSADPPRNDGWVDDLALETTTKFNTAEATSTGRQAVAENINSLQFRYLNKDGEITATSADIESILVFFVAVASTPDPNFRNTRTYTYTYTSPGGTATTITSPAYNDNLRRRLFVSIIQCRNLSL